MAKSNVDLVIRARNEASKALSSISSALRDVTKDQKALADQAGSTDSLLGELGSELGRLDSRLKDLRSVNRLATDLDKTTSALNRQKAATQEAQLRYTSLAKALSDTEKPTKRMQNQLAAAERRLTSNREKTAALEQSVAALGSQYSEARADLGGLAADEDALARSTARAAAEFTALQAQMRELRNTAKGGDLIDLSGLNVAGLSRAGEAIQDVGRRVRDAGQASDLTAVDLKALSREVDQLEGVMSDLGELKTLTTSFGEMRRESQQARRTWKDLEAQAKTLAIEFANAEQPSQELAQRLGETRAAARQAKTVYQQSRNSVKQFGDALRTAGVDTTSLATAQKSLETNLETTANVLARSRIELDRLNDEQQALVQSQAEAAVAAEKEQKARQDALRAGSQALRVYRQTKDAVTEAEQAYRDATEQVTRIARAMRETEQPTAAMNREFEQAKKRAADLKTNFRDVQEASGLLARNLRENRTDAEALATGQRNLETALERSANRLRQTGEAAAKTEKSLSDFREQAERARVAAQQTGDGVEDAGQGMQTFATQTRKADDALRAFRDQGRTTLSLLQRLRGQVLGLASAYVGLYGVGAGVSGIASAQMGLEATQSRLRVAVGDDPKAVAAELEFVKQVSEDLRLEFQGLSEEYGKFASAAVNSGASINEVRAVFLGLAKAGRVNKLTADEMRRAMNALTQMFSKGKITAEELRQQLAEAGIAGAVGLMADAIGVTGAELDKMLQNGEVTSEALIYFAKELEERFGPALGAAIQSTAADLADFRNSVYELRLIVAQSGFIDALGDSLNRVTEILSTGEAQQGARRLGEALGNLMITLADLLQYMDEIILALKLLATAIGVKWAANLVAGLVEAMAKLRTFQSAVAGATGAVRAFYLTLTGIGVFLAAWSIAEWAAEEFPAFGRFWAAFKANLLAGLAELRADFAMTWVRVKDAFTGNLDAMTGLFSKWAGDLAGQLASLFELVGNGPISDGLRSFQSAAYDYAGDTLSDEAQKELDRIRAELRLQLAEIDKAGFEAFQRSTAQMNGGANLTPTTKPGGGDVGMTVEDVLGRSIDNEDFRRDLSAVMAKIEDEIATRSADTLQERLDLIRAGYAELLAELADRGDDAAIAKVEKLIQLRQDEERAKAAAEAARSPAAREAERMSNELERVRQRITELTADTLDERLALVRNEFTDLLAYLERTGNETGLASVEELIRLQQEQERIKYNREQEQKLAERQRGIEQEVNDLFALRRDLQEQIQFYRSSDEPGADAAITELESRLAGVDAKLQEALNKAIAFAREIGDPNMVANLELMRLKLVSVENKLVSAEQVNRAFASGVANGMQSAADAVGGLILGLQNGASAFASVRDAFLSFAADFLRQIANMIIQQAVFNALQASSGGGIGGAIASIFHEGGVVGHGSAPSRAVPASWFQNAVRYHTGGIAGLKPNEVPAVLERGEEVLTRKDPRHSMNGGAPNQQSVKIVNTFDAGEMVSAGLNTPAGEKVIMNFMSRNRQKIKQALG